MLQNLVLVSTFGLLLWAVGWTLDTWQFWCFMGLFWCSQQLGRMFGRVEGIMDYLEMSTAEQNRIKRAIEEAKREVK